MEFWCVFAVSFSLNLSPSEPITILIKYGLYRSVEVVRQPHRSECVTEFFFPICQPKSMLCILKTTVSMKQFF